MQIFLPYKDEEFNVELEVIHVEGSLVSSHLVLEIVHMEVVVLVSSVVLVQPTYIDVEEFTVELTV